MTSVATEPLPLPDSMSAICTRLTADASASACWVSPRNSRHTPQGAFARDHAPGHFGRHLLFVSARQGVHCPVVGAQVRQFLGGQLEGLVFLDRDRDHFTHRCLHSIVNAAARSNLQHGQNHAIVHDDAPVAGIACACSKPEAEAR